ncbi:hypothetical protein PR048_007626 [Dryococelus australis]|uniref:HAT C-terminal dimerisation domain-containing protein n=1 Tax=Dryococelus australis TaxID=614101 RepID=A0ABQ9HUT3_9NEOP|nr:hypothetical protein PR048_007626 [Dryococelus australis]
MQRELKSNKQQPRSFLVRAKPTSLQEVNNYLGEPVLQVTCDPLAYWKTSPFHMLKKVAVKYLSAPAGSIASERLFSTAELHLPTTDCKWIQTNFANSYF